jgi:hypothetical protein
MTFATVQNVILVVPCRLIDTDFTREGLEGRGYVLGHLKCQPVREELNSIGNRQENFHQAEL